MTSQPAPDKVYEILGKFKALKRRGWIKRECKQTESDAEHSWGIAFLVMKYAPAELDKLKCLQMALVHDMPEIIAGDIIPADHVGEQDKQKSEQQAATYLAKNMGLPLLQELFEEFEAAQTTEAKFVKDLDKLDMVMQCSYFIEQGQLSADAWDEFVPYSRERIKTPLVKQLFEDVCHEYESAHRPKTIIPANRPAEPKTNFL